MDNLQVWIPAQAASTRVRNKNFRPFCSGKSLLEIKLEQLISAGILPQNIYVSTDTSQISIIADKYKINVIDRNINLLGNNILQSNLFKHFFNNTPDSKYVMWVQVTDPLFSNFELFVNRLIKDKIIKQTLVLATKLKKHAFFNGMPLNFQFGDWHSVSQNLTPLIIPRWSVFLHMRSELEKIMYHFGIKNEFILTNDPYIDIDTLKDFKLAQAVYMNLMTFR